MLVEEEKSILFYTARLKIQRSRKCHPELIEGYTNMIRKFTMIVYSYFKREDKLAEREWPKVEGGNILLLHYHLTIRRITNCVADKLVESGTDSNPSQKVKT